MQNRVKAFDDFNEYGIEPAEINIKKCIKYVSRAWGNVTSTTIKNCWTKANILPKYDYGSDDENEINTEGRENCEDSADIRIELERLKELEEVQVLINKLDLENPFTAEEFVQYDKSETAREMISNEEILKAVLPNEKEKEIEIEEIPLPTITHNEAIESYDKVILYLEQREEDFNVKEDLKLIKKLRKEALKQRFISARQGNLDRFVNVIE